MNIIYCIHIIFREAAQDIEMTIFEIYRSLKTDNQKIGKRAT